MSAALNSETHTEKLIRQTLGEFEGFERQAEMFQKGMGLYVPKDGDALASLTAIRTALVRALDALPQGGWNTEPVYSVVRAVACLDRVIEKLANDAEKAKAGK